MYNTYRITIGQFNQSHRAALSVWRLSTPCCAVTVAIASVSITTFLEWNEVFMGSCHQMGPHIDIIVRVLCVRV